MEIAKIIEFYIKRVPGSFVIPNLNIKRYENPFRFAFSIIRIFLPWSLHHALSILTRQVIHIILLYHGHDISQLIYRLSEENALKI